MIMRYLLPKKFLMLHWDYSAVPLSDLTYVIISGSTLTSVIYVPRLENFCSFSFYFGRGMVITLLCVGGELVKVKQT